MLFSDNLDVMYLMYFILKTIILQPKYLFCLTTVMSPKTVYKRSTLSIFAPKSLFLLKMTISISFKEYSRKG